MDKRRYYEKLKSGHIVNVDPDIQADFTDMPFDDEHFDLVVFDPPHLIHAGKTSWLAKKYGTLDKSTWSMIIHDGFAECNRVVKPNGRLFLNGMKNKYLLAKFLKLLDEIHYLATKEGKHVGLFLKRKQRVKNNG